MTLPERISARTSRVRPADALKTVAAAPFYLLGWCGGTLIFALAWFWAAIAVGFTDGRRKPAS